MSALTDGIFLVSEVDVEVIGKLSDHVIGDFIHHFVRASAAA